MLVLEPLAVSQADWYFLYVKRVRLITSFYLQPMIHVSAFSILKDFSSRVDGGEVR